MSSKKELATTSSTSVTIDVVHDYLNPTYLPKTREEYRKVSDNLDSFANKMNGLIGWKKGQMLVHLKGLNKYGDGLIKEEAAASGVAESTLYKLISIFETHPANDKASMKRLQVMDISKVKATLVVKDPEKRVAFEKKIVENNMTLVEINKEIKIINPPKAPKIAPSKKTPEAKVATAPELSKAMRTSFQENSRALADALINKDNLLALCNDEDRTTDEDCGFVVEDMDATMRHVIFIEGVCKKFREHHGEVKALFE